MVNKNRFSFSEKFPLKFASWSKLKLMQIISTFPPAGGGGRRGTSKMARGPEGDKWVPCKFLTTVPLAYFWSVDSIDFKFAHVLQCNKLFCLSVHGTSHLTFNKSQFFQIRTTYIFEMFFSSNEQRQHKINSRYLYCRL